MNPEAVLFRGEPEDNPVLVLALQLFNARRSTQERKLQELVELREQARINHEKANEAVVFQTREIEEDTLAFVRKCLQALPETGYLDYYDPEGWEAFAYESSGKITLKIRRRKCK